MCPARPRFAPGVTIEEDNCCGCNAIAIRRHFLDENMTAVDIVYTSCHDAVRVQAGWSTASPQPGSCAGCRGQAGLPSVAGALGLAGIAPLGGQTRAGPSPSPHILACAHSAARKWTPALPLLLGLPGSSLWGKELRDVEKHWGGERAAFRTRQA